MPEQKNMFLKGLQNSLKVKVMFSFIVMVLVCTIGLAFFLSYRDIQFMEEISIDQVNMHLNSFEALIQEEKEKLALAQGFLLRDEQLQRAIVERDREGVHERLHFHGDVLEKDFSITQMQVIDSDLHSFYRYHNPEAYGDDLSHRVLLQEVRNREVFITAFDEGVFGYAIRGTGPVYEEDGTLLAILEVGIFVDNAFLAQARDRIGVQDLTVFLDNERVATTVLDEQGEPAVGSVIEQREIIEEVLLGGGRWVNRLEIVGGNDIFGAYTAIRDAQGAVTGMLFAGQSARVFDEHRNQTIMFSALLVLGITILTGLLALVLVRRIVLPINELSSVFQDLATGDLRVSSRVYSGDEVGKMAGAFNATVASLAETIQRVQAASENVERGAESISQGNQDLSQRTEEQAASLEELSSTVESVAHSIAHSSQNAIEADTISQNTLENVQKGEEAMGEMIEAMGEITTSSKEIADIIEKVNDIAFQTNLLALNAAVEAARAGEQGRGFAVVAAEVRNLARRASDASGEIERLIKDSMGKVERGNALMEGTASTLTEIVKNTEKTNGVIGEIASSLQEQNQSVQEIKTALDELNQVTQHNSSLVEELASSSEEMRSEALELDRILQTFKIES